MSFSTLFSIFMMCSDTLSRMIIDYRKHATMIFDDFNFLSPKYILIFFMSIGNGYFPFILLVSTFYSLFIHTT